MANYFCPICLTQGRKMFPFPLNYTKLPFSTFYKDLKLTNKDTICWECRSFVLRMAAFRQKALTAQANLATWGKRPWTTLQSLSKLAISKGVNLDIIDIPEQPDPLNLDKVKTETDINIDSHENNEFGEENYDMADVKDELFDVNSETGDVNNEIGDGNNEMGDVTDKIGDETNETGDINIKIGNENKDVLFEVFQHKTCVVPESNNWKEVVDVNDGNIANATLMSLLTRKSSLLFPPTNDTTSKDSSTSEHKREIYVDKHPQEPTNMIEPKDTQITINSFTEETLTEEEMRIWWDSKRQNEFYANSIPVFRCEKCVEPFYTRRSFLGHQKIHTEIGELLCDLCELRFKTETALATHKAKHYRLLKCVHCDLKWDNPNSMRRHCNSEHGIPVTEWNCDVCTKQLPSYGRYLNHIKGHRSESCPDCGRKVQPIHLKTHMLTHDTSLEKKYECADCGSMFRSKDLVRTHIRRMHITKQADDSAFCVDCNRHFRSMTSYKTHMKFASKHVAAELLRHKCGECPRAFTSGVLLRRHVEAKHSEQRNYPCQVCHARFRNSTARSRHRRVLHEGYVAPRHNMCDYCGKSFQTKGQLSIHMNTHTGARPFVCKLCGADFGHKSALYLHGRYKHKIQKKRGGKKDNTDS